MARTRQRIKWWPEEDLYCVTRFIENYFEELIKTGKPISSQKMNLEVKLYNEIYNSKRTEGSVRLKFHNIEHLAFKYIEEKGNPYNIKILKRMSKVSKQCLKSWENQINQCNSVINWMNKK